MRHTRTNSLEARCKIDATNFTIVMLVVVLALLAVEMLQTHPFHTGCCLDLPKVGHPVNMWGASRRDALTVVVARDGSVYFGTDRVEPRMLAAKLREQLGHSAQRKVYVRADARARYGHVSTVLDAVRSSGIMNVAFLVDQRRVRVLPDSRLSVVF